MSAPQTPDRRRSTVRVPRSHNSSPNTSPSTPFTTPGSESSHRGAPEPSSSDHAIDKYKVKAASNPIRGKSKKPTDLPSINPPSGYKSPTSSSSPRSLRQSVRRSSSKLSMSEPQVAKRTGSLDSKSEQSPSQNRRQSKKGNRLSTTTAANKQSIRDTFNISPDRDFAFQDLTSDNEADPSSVQTSTAQHIDDTTDLEQNAKQIEPLPDQGRKQLSKDLTSQPAGSRSSSRTTAVQDHSVDPPSSSSILEHKSTSKDDKDAGDSTRPDRPQKGKRKRLSEQIQRPKAPLISSESVPEMPSLSSRSKHLSVTNRKKIRAVSEPLPTRRSDNSDSEDSDNDPAKSRRGEISSLRGTHHEDVDSKFKASDAVPAEKQREEGSSLKSTHSNNSDSEGSDTITPKNQQREKSPSKGVHRDNSESKGNDALTPKTKRGKKSAQEITHQDNSDPKSSDSSAAETQRGEKSSPKRAPPSTSQAKMSKKNEWKSDTDIMNELITNLPNENGKEANSEGYVYIYTSPLYPGHVKIGSTKKSPQVRVNEWEKKCKITCTRIGDPEDRMFSSFRLVERFIQLELWNERRNLCCDICKKTHQRNNVSVTEKQENSEARSHGEWYQITEEYALELVQKWRNWIRNCSPYNNSGKLRRNWLWKLELAKESREIPYNWEVWTQPFTPLEICRYLLKQIDLVYKSSVPTLRNILMYPGVIVLVAIPYAYYWGGTPALLSLFLGIVGILWFYLWHE